MESLARLGRRAVIGLGLATLPGMRASRAGAWPDRPVRLIVPFGAGGAVDTLSRSVAQYFPAHAGGQTLVVENRGGAGGTIAGAVVATQRPDGGTLMMADLGANAIAKELQPSLGYDPARAFTPVCHLVNLPIVVIARANFPAEDLPGVIAEARRAGGGLSYAHPGIGHASHLGMEMLLRRTGLAMTPVSYRSGAEVLRSIMQGECDLAFPTVSTALPFIREGRVKAIAVGAGPVPALPGAAPVAATLEGFEATVWHGIVGPAGLPAEIVATANGVFNAILGEAALREQLARVQAAEIVGGTPEEFARFIAAEIARWTPIIRAAGIRAE